MFIYIFGINYVQSNVEIIVAKLDYFRKKKHKIRDVDTNFICMRRI